MNKWTIQESLENFDHERFNENMHNLLVLPKMLKKTSNTEEAKVLQEKKKNRRYNI